MDDLAKFSNFYKNTYLTKVCRFCFLCRSLPLPFPSLPGDDRDIPFFLVPFPAISRLYKFRIYPCSCFRVSRWSQKEGQAIITRTTWNPWLVLSGRSGAGARGQICHPSAPAQTSGQAQASRAKASRAESRFNRLARGARARARASVQTWIVQFRTISLVWRQLALTCIER